MYIENFYKHLHSKYMGRTLLYGHELTSTQTILSDNFKDYQSGLVCIADKQNAGRGRSSNKWDSPYGCLMFSFKTYITNGRDLPMLQYLTTLVMCNSLEDIYNTGVGDRSDCSPRTWTFPLSGRTTSTTTATRKWEALSASRTTTVARST